MAGGASTAPPCAAVAPAPAAAGAVGAPTEQQASTGGAGAKHTRDQVGTSPNRQLLQKPKLGLGGGDEQQSDEASGEQQGDLAVKLFE